MSTFGAARGLLQKWCTGELRVILLRSRRGLNAKQICKRHLYIAPLSDRFPRLFLCDRRFLPSRLSFPWELRLLSWESALKFGRERMGNAGNVVHFCNRVTLAGADCGEALPSCSSGFQWGDSRRSSSAVWPRSRMKRCYARSWISSLQKAFMLFFLEWSFRTRIRLCFKIEECYYPLAALGKSVRSLVLQIHMHYLSESDN